MSAETAETDRNEVTLVGRVSGPVVPRSLPSGDELVAWRLVVRRPAAEAATRRPTIDTIDCVAFAGDARHRVGEWRDGDVVTVRGALRRRFWRAAGGAASRVEVLVDDGQLLRSAARVLAEERPAAATDAESVSG